MRHRAEGVYDLQPTVTILQHGPRYFAMLLKETEPSAVAAPPENHVGDLPNSWANAGAFYLLTLKSKLDHNQSKLFFFKP